MYGKVIQLYVCVCIYRFIYTYIYIFFFRLFSLIGYYKILIIIPCAIQ